MRTYHSFVGARRMLGRAGVLGVAVSVVVACSSESSSDGDGEEGDGGDGATGGSGAVSGGTSGAQATGGTTPTSGGSTGIGGSGTGGASGGSSTTPLVVRCVDLGDDNRMCYGTPGTDNWAVAWKGCSIEPSRNDPDWEVGGPPAAFYCGAASGALDDPTGWDETFCVRLRTGGTQLCFGRIGEWWLEIWPECAWDELEYAKFPGDPAQIFCGAPSTANGGWDELRCFNPGGDAVDRCWGRRGAYWVGPSAIGLWLNGLTPTCRLEGTSITPDQVPCPSGGTGGTSGSGGGGAAGVGAAGGPSAGAGGGNDPRYCPPSQPMGMMPCTPGTHCTYGQIQCDCAPPWTCSG